MVCQQGKLCQHVRLHTNILSTGTRARGNTGVFSLLLIYQSTLQHFPKLCKLPVFSSKNRFYNNRVRYTVEIKKLFLHDWEIDCTVSDNTHEFGGTKNKNLNDAYSVKSTPFKSASTRSTCNVAAFDARERGLRHLQLLCICATRPLLSLLPQTKRPSDNTVRYLATFQHQIVDKEPWYINGLFQTAVHPT